MNIRVYRGAPTINHLLFANDSFIFCKVMVEASNHLLEILKNYTLTSSQYVNTKKTIMIFSQNVKEFTKSKITSKWSYKDIKQYKKYLGLPPIIGCS